MNASVSGATSGATVASTNVIMDIDRVLHFHPAGGGCAVSLDVDAVYCLP
jgi:hypothetical protein